MKGHVFFYGSFQRKGGRKCCKKDRKALRKYVKDTQGNNKRQYEMTQKGF